MVSTRKLPRPKPDPARILGALRPALVQGWRRLRTTKPDGFTAVGLGFAVLLTLAVLIAALRPYGSDQRETLGEWRSWLDQATARRAVEVIYTPDSGRVRLKRVDGIAALEGDSRRQRFLQTHINRFNQATSGRPYQPNLVPRDCIFTVRMENVGNRRNAVLEIRDLSAYNSYPTNRQVTRTLGNIYMRPMETDLPYFSDGYVSLLPLPGELQPEDARLDRPGLYSGSPIQLLGPNGNVKAVVRAAPDGRAVMVSSQDRRGIFIDNNPPESEGEVRLEPGQTVEIAGRFFEVRATRGLMLAGNTQRGNQVKRIYPMGQHFHVVGPVSLTGGHQSLGIEYMFREYLEGEPEEGIPPGEIWLTLDPAMQGELAELMAKLLPQSQMNQGSALMMNAKTGAILAMAAEPNNTYDPADRGKILQLLEDGEAWRTNHGSFRRHVIGSVTKPFFAFLALHLLPESEALRMEGATGPTIFGHPVYAKQGQAFIWKENPATFREYLVNSHNGFQHSLGFLLLAGVEDLSQIPAPYRNPQQNNLLRPMRAGDPMALGNLQARSRVLPVRSDTPVAVAIRDIFAIATEAGTGIAHDRDISIYGPLLETAKRLLTRFNPGLEDAEALLRRRSVVCAPEYPRMVLEEVRNTPDASNVLFGANRNTWTDVKLCESFSRMITGRKVEARLVYKFTNTLGLTAEEAGAPGGDEETAADPEQPIEPPAEVLCEAEAPTLQEAGISIDPKVFSSLRSYLAEVPKTGTAKELAPVIEQIRRQPGSRRFMLFAKTGTIDDGRDLNDSKLFIGTFGLWNESRADFDGDAYTFVIYLRNAVDEKAVVKAVGEALPRWWSQGSPLLPSQP